MEKMPSIYDRLGDEKLLALVNNFYDHVMKDKRISGLFTTDLALVKRKQFMFLTQFFGGPPRYAETYGHPRMRLRHMPHEITPDAAMAWLENMSEALRLLDIDKEFKDEIMQRFPHVAAHMVNKG